MNLFSSYDTFPWARELVGDCYFGCFVESNVPLDANEA